jgi:hypothetical protein
VPSVDRHTGMPLWRLPFTSTVCDEGPNTTALVATSSIEIEQLNGPRAVVAAKAGARRDALPLAPASGVRRDPDRTSARGLGAVRRTAGGARLASFSPSVESLGQRLSHKHD